MLLDRIGPEEFEKRELVCGDAYAFQGDERDIMFLSLVAAPNVTIGPLVKESYKRRFNVAASRAKDQVWLFHTATLNDLNKECMRYKLLDYYQNPQPIQYDEIDPSVFESKFEEDVFERIVSKGYRVIPQFKVAKYRLDLVVEGTKTRLAIECDGDEFHGADQYEKDMARQRNLERCKWAFWRIRGCEFYRDPVAALEPLWQKLEEMEIYPKKPDKDTHGSPQSEAEPMDNDQAREEYRESQTRDSGFYSGNGAIDSDGEDGTGGCQVRVDEDYTEEHKESDDDVDFVSTFSADTWFDLARWAKLQDNFQGWERKLLYHIGIRVSRNKKLTPKQAKQVRRLYQEAMNLGYRKPQSL